MKQVLVVDDDADFRLLTNLTLTRAGFEVVEAEDGRRALGILREAHPDLVVVDLMMDKGPGWSLIRRFGRSRPLTSYR